MLKEKYQPVFDLAKKLGVRFEKVEEEGGKLKVKGVSPYQLDKNLVWDKIKAVPGWEKDLMMNLSIEKTEIFGMYTVQPGDTLSKLAKQFLGSPDKFKAIFELNTDVLKDPDMIKVGQKLRIPNQ